MLVPRCEPGQLHPVLNSLVYSASVDGLRPYTNYEFQLSVDNDAGSLEQPVSTFATTLPAGIDYRLSIIDYLLILLVLQLFVTQRLVCDLRY